MGSSRCRTKKWTRAHSENVTVRKLFDLATFDISFELGAFWNENEQLREHCAANLNATWFYQTHSHAREDEEEAVLADALLTLNRRQRTNDFTALFVLTALIVGAIVRCVASDCSRTTATAAANRKTRHC